ncbi:hypothetical protein BC940DRAFT_296101 [Gongronella butleri]|nr:hypothetical protein BC940DRAFT_296101 [Gongronella butleri]
MNQAAAKPADDAIEQQSPHDEQQLQAEQEQALSKLCLMAWSDWLNEVDCASSTCVPELSPSGDELDTTDPVDVSLLGKRKRTTASVVDSSDEEDGDEYNPLADLDLVEVTFDTPLLIVDHDAHPPFNKKQRFVDDDFTLASLEPKGAALELDDHWILDMDAA